VVTHGACRVDDTRSYNLSNATIRRVAERRGVIGLLLCREYLCAGAQRARPRTVAESFDLLLWHIERIREISGSNEHAAIGTDFDGFIEPIYGFDSPRALAGLEAFLIERYGGTEAEKICSGNAMRLLRECWVGTSP
jgi:microsomal dipeptidase-like Zn-dependent dipeptidase